MIEKWLKMLAGFIVDALLAKLGIENLDDLLAKAAAAFKAELSEDLGKIDDIPGQVITAVTGQLGGVVQQLSAIPSQLGQQVAGIPGQVLSGLPDFGALITNTIRNLLPHFP
jgi:hypothetical protein